MITSTHKYTFRISTLVLFTLYLLILVGSLNASGSSLVIIGLLSLFVVIFITTVGMLIYLFKLQKIHKLQLYMLLLMVLLVFVCIISMSINGFDVKDLTNSIQMIACFNMILYLTFVKVTHRDISMISTLVAIFIVFHFLLFLLTGMPKLFSSIYSNSNLMGPYMFYTLFFIICSLKFSRHKFFYIIIFIMNLLLIFASDTRSIWLSFGITFIVYFLWKYIIRGHLFAILFFCIVITLTLSFIFIYPLLPTLHVYNSIETWMLANTGKSIMSGRSELWIPLIEYINQHPLFGYGPGTLAEELYAFDQSPHNLYLNILMQIGYIGLGCVLSIFLMIWTYISRVKDDFVVKLSASFLIGIIVHQSFEVTLFQNQLSIGLLQVFIIGVGLSTAVNKNDNLLME